ncbi:MAG: acetyltransferase [Candidatus Sericytochromatia bacterium]
MKLLIWGTGGLGRGILELVQSMPEHPYTEIGFIDDLRPAGEKVLGIPILGNRSLLSEQDPAKTEVSLATVMPENRLAMAHYLKERQLRSPTLIDPRAVVRPSARLGEGCVVYPFALINSQAEIGEHVLISASVTVPHDAKIGDGVSLLNGCRALGFVEIGTGALIGAGAIIKPSCKLGAWSRISMGSVVLADMPDYSTAAGNPARLLKQATHPPEIQLCPL